MHNLAEVHEYWFGENSAAPDQIAERNKLWFGKDERVDREIALRFGRLLEQLLRTEIDSINLQSVADRLALILVLDQFTRNVYRGTAQAFAGDAQALRLCLEGLKRGDDRQLRPLERVFFYLPLEHSEELKMQDRSVDLFHRLQRGLPPNQQDAFSGFVDYAERHRAIIKRFGRFPHRNKLLGRPSTAAEREFLQQPNSSF